METLPSDVLRLLVYTSGLVRVEDKVALVLSCRSILCACTGGEFAADGGEAHWRREAEEAGFVMNRHHAVQHWRSVFFERKALRCACCNVPISHRTGRMTTTGYQGRGVRLSSCVRCGPLVHVEKHDALDADSVEYVFGRYASRRHLETMMQQAAETRTHQREERRSKEVREALMLSGMSSQRVELALVGSAAFSTYLRLTKDDGAALTGTVANICRRHWMSGYTWLPCASTLCGLPCSNATKEHLYRLVLTCYGGYPAVWPWSGSRGTSDREVLADMLVDFYADSMMLDALFQRLVENDLCWLGDHAWLGRIRDALLGQHRRHRRPRRAVSFVAMNPGMRVAQLVLEAEFVGGYRVRTSAWHVTFSVQ